MQHLIWVYTVWFGLSIPIVRVYALIWSQISLKAWHTTPDYTALCSLGLKFHWRRHTTPDCTTLCCTEPDHISPCCLSKSHVHVSKGPLCRMQAVKAQIILHMNRLNKTICCFHLFETFFFLLPKAPLFQNFNRGHPRWRFGRKSLPKLADFSLSWAEGEVKIYRMYREIQNFLPKLLPEIPKLAENFSLSVKALGCTLLTVIYYKYKL